MSLNDLKDKSTEESELPFDEKETFGDVTRPPRLFGHKTDYSSGIFIGEDKPFTMFVPKKYEFMMVVVGFFDWQIVSSSKVKNEILDDIMPYKPRTHFDELGLDGWSIASYIEIPNIEGMLAFIMQREIP